MMIRQTKNFTISNKKIKISEDVENLNSTISNFNILDVYGTPKLWLYDAFSFQAHTEYLQN